MSPATFTQILNALGLLGLTLVLLTALLLQFILGELPCPLCLLQRVGMVAAGFGLFLNLRFGPHPAHYGVVLLGALFGAATATRQILLHIVPGTGEYGSALFGYHLYTWCLVIFMLAIAAVAILLLLEGQFDLGSYREPPAFGNLVCILFTATTVVLMAVHFLQCGPSECPDDPTTYWILGQLGGGP